MDRSWWLVLVAVVLLAVVATLVDGWGRGHRPARGGGPRASEIWWVGGPGVEEWLCVVLGVRGRRAVVAAISGEGRSGAIPLPAGSAGSVDGRPGFVETDGVREVPVRDFRRRAGVVDPVLWDQVRHLAD